PPSAPPPSAPPWGPPAGPPPPPEYLEAGGGHPLPPQPPAARRGGKKKYVIGGVAVVAVGAVAAGAWAAVSFFSTGDQPAQALPASTLGYVSIDLDPSGGQKIEALRTLRKFPAFKDQVGLDTDDDLRQKVFEQLQKGEVCSDVDYGDDIEPWLGDRMAAAAVRTDDDTTSPVVVVQVKDAGKAEDGFAKLRDCLAGEQQAATAEPPGLDDEGQSEEDQPSEMGGWAIEGDWAIIAETTEIAEQVASDAKEDSLADDADFQRWTGEAGDAGILTAYAAPEVGDLMADAADELSGLGGALSGPSCVEEPESFDPDTIDPDPLDPDSLDPDSLEPELPELPDYDAPCDDSGDENPVDGATDEIVSMFEDFEGAALTVRFDDGSLEVEAATGTGFAGLDALSGSDQGGVAISTLPEDTAAAWGVGFEEGWFDELLEYASSFAGDDMNIDELIQQAEEETGLSLPEDAETLAGESATVAVGSDFDPDALGSGEPGDVPVGMKVKGDPEAIEGVLAKIVAKLSASEPEAGELLGSDSDGDYVAVGPNADYRASLLEDGGLGDTDTFKDVVREADQSGSVLFVNFDAGDGWLVNLASGMGDDEELSENLEPLEGLGISGWTDGDVTHSVFRLTTN
ncbi:DUF3352 domain-containing protein, partial [Nocardioides lijunqiniae]|uniref:DUF3352 domain-containing protein n=1 Tax=Nocardioides lijunqiniae TaxID=2760832 RepID=UPI001878F03C